MYGHTKERDFLLGALVGGAIATLTTLLFTTKRGKAIQHKIVETFEDLEESAKEGLTKAKDKVEDAAEHTRKKAAHALSDSHHKKEDKDK